MKYVCIIMNRFNRGNKIFKYELVKKYKGKENSMKNNMHRYLKIIGGFLSVKVHREDNQPKISFRHHDVNGEIQNKDIWSKN